MKKNKTNLVAWLLVAINASALFYASSQPVEKSREASLKATKAIIRTLEEVYPEIQDEITIKEVHRKVRKSSHFVLYMMLGFLMANALKQKGKHKIAYSLLICVLISMLDETYQLTVPGRGADINDVLIDSMGATVGIGINYGIEKMSKVKNKKQLKIKLTTPSKVL